MNSKNKDYERIINSNRVIHNSNPISEPQKAKIFRIKNDIKPRMKILPIIVLAGAIGTAAAIGGINLTKLIANLPPTPNEQIEDKKFYEDYNKALEQYSKEAHRTGQEKEFSRLELKAGEVAGMINGKYVAFSTTSPKARYLNENKEEYVSNSDLINFVKTYSVLKQ